jgi:hypothetical protein
LFVAALGLTEITHSFLWYPFSKLIVFVNPKNSSEYLMEIVETTSTSKTLYWVSSGGDIRLTNSDYEFTAAQTSATSGVTVVDSTVSSAQRGVAVPNDAA